MATKAKTVKAPARTVKPAAKTPQRKKTIQKETPKKTTAKKEPEKKELVKKLVRVEVLAKFVGVTVRRIQQLQQEGVIKPEPVKNKKEGAKYDFLTCLYGIITYYRERADRRSSAESKEMEGEKILQISTKRKLEELKLKQLEGDLHKTADIERVMGALLTRLRINLLAIPLGVATQLRGETDVNLIAEKINERISRALNEVVDLDLDKLIANEKEDYSE